MDRNTHVGGNAKCFRCFALGPALGHVIAEHRVTIQRALAQRLIPWDAQALRDRHLLAVASVENVLQPRFDIHLRQVGRLHVGDNLQHLQQLANEAFKGLLGGKGF